QFASSRDDAVFHAVCGEWFDDLPCCSGSPRDAAGAALDAVKFQPGRGPDQLVLAGLSAAQNAEVVRDCDDLVMIRAGALAQSGSPEAAARALGALKDLPLRAQHTLAYHMIRARLLAQSGQRQAATEEDSEASASVPVTWSDYFAL